MGRDERSSLLSRHHLLSFEFLLRFFLLRGWFVVHGTASTRENVLLLAHDQLDVTRRRLVRIDAAVRAERTPTDLRRAVHLNVIDDQVINVETFDIGARFDVLEQIEKNLG